MTNNVIDLFARGNQELFHSAFIAWLLDKQGTHDLGSKFLDGFKSKLPKNISDRLKGSLKVLTEYRLGSFRFDIALKLESTSSNAFEGLVLENKIKSFGNAVQLDNYNKSLGVDVVVLALLPETLDDAARNSYPVVKYSDVNDILQELPLDPANHYQFLVHEYRTFLSQTLSTYKSIAQYCNGSTSMSDFLAELKTGLSSSVLRDNDIRTYSYYYYYLLAEYIGKSTPDLVFGTRTYAQAEQDKENTKWEFEKNLPGPPYMEAIIFRPCDTSPWKLHAALASIHTSEPVTIAPRIEVKLDPNRICTADAHNPIVGTLMLGTWNSDLKQALRNNEPYASTLKRKQRANRNFHCEDLALSEIPFETIIPRIRRALTLIFNRNPTSS